MLINVTNLQTKLLFQERNNRVILKGISLVLYIHTNIINFKLLHENSVLGITKTTRFNVSDLDLAKLRLVKHPVLDIIRILFRVMGRNVTIYFYYFYRQIYFFHNL